MMNIVVPPEDLKRYTSKSWEELPEPAREYIRIAWGQQISTSGNSAEELDEAYEKNKESGAMK